MPCYKPLKGWLARGGGITFHKQESLCVDMEVPCGQCIGCRLDRSQEWALRCVLESSLYEDNCFLTLTYAPENLPAGGSLVKSHFQKFMKSLRKDIAPRKVRYFMCGEYGEKYERPHYHALLFNYRPADLELLGTGQDYNLYSSEYLSGLWKKGFVSVGEVNYETAAYTARYVVKKLTGELGRFAYQRVCPVTGELHEIEPEYSTQSRNPGIAYGWFQKYKSDVFPGDFIVLNGKKHKVPRYFTSKLDDDKELKRIKKERRKGFRTHYYDNTSERLHEREQVQIAKASLLKRNMELQ